MPFLLRALSAGGIGSVTASRLVASFDGSKELLDQRLVAIEVASIRGGRRASEREEEGDDNQ